jgi:acyl-CoA synthetase (AMP-forming)/AMP-acid ligase II
MAHPAVHDAAVVGAPDTVLGERVAGLVQLSECAQLGVGALAARRFPKPGHGTGPEATRRFFSMLHQMVKKLEVAGAREDGPLAATVLNFT